MLSFMQTFSTFFLISIYHLIYQRRLREKAFENIFLGKRRKYWLYIVLYPVSSANVYDMDQFNTF